MSPQDGTPDFSWRLELRFFHFLSGGHRLVDSSPHHLLLRQLKRNGRKDGSDSSLTTMLMAQLASEEGLRHTASDLTEPSASSKPIGPITAGA